MLADIVKDYTIQSAAAPIHAAYHPYEDSSILQPAIAKATLDVLEIGK